jgi:hypothetical protein
MTAQLEFDFTEPEPAPVYAVHCFFNCPHVARKTDPYTASAAMEAHYTAAHDADIRRVLTEAPPSPSDPPQRRRRRR